jgi:pantetheine-phosphate adenylyltransferase
MNKSRVAIYPGTFDPITNGHVDIVRRSRKLSERLIVAIAANPEKRPLLTLEERVQMVRDEVATEADENGGVVEVRAFDNLLMQFALEVGATIIIRGLRAVSDFEYEFQLATTNARLEPSVETIYLMASDGHHFIASRLVKEIGRFGGDVSGFVSPQVERHLARAFERERRLRDADIANNKG